MAHTKALARFPRMKRICSVVAVVSSCLAVACSGSVDPSGEEDTLESDLTKDAGAAAKGDASADAGKKGADASADAGVATTFVDPRDQQSYPLITFGKVTWFARNLNVELTSGSYCYDDDDTNCARDGHLYTWAAAQMACPKGSRLASDADWKALETAVGMDAGDLDLEGYSTVRGTDEGTTLKSKKGFAAQMAGFRSGASYDARDDRTYFWTSSTRGSDVWRRRIAGAESTIFRFTNPPEGFAISVRCVVE